MEPRTSVGDEIRARPVADDTAGSGATSAGTVEDDAAEQAADDEDGGWPGPIDEPPPLFS